MNFDNVNERPTAASTTNVQPNVLANIYQSTNIAIWPRKLPLAFISNLEQLLASEANLSIVERVSPHSAADQLKSKLSDFACAEELSEDIALLVDMFCCLFGRQEAGLRLTTLSKPMCPNFHVDHIPVRLVTTYLGTATQWLEDDNVKRERLGTGNPSDEVFAYTDIQQMQPGDVALLKGSGWEGNEHHGLVHRSPQNRQGERRLLLTLDCI
ncbi:DUF1826 domain-containing protein [Vibrio sp. AK197]